MDCVSHLFGRNNTLLLLKFMNFKLKRDVAKGKQDKKSPRKLAMTNLNILDTMRFFKEVLHYQLA